MENENSTMLATGSMILGIISVCICGIIGVFGVSFPIAGLLLGVISLRENNGGRKKAISGVTMSLLGIFLMVLSSAIVTMIIWNKIRH